eukprot:2689011-Pyramimonas_sp.AAC.1
MQGRVEACWKLSRTRRRLERPAGGTCCSPLVSVQNPDREAKARSAERSRAPHGDLCQAAWNDAWAAGDIAGDACEGVFYDARGS